MPLLILKWRGQNDKGYKQLADLGKSFRRQAARKPQLHLGLQFKEMSIVNNMNETETGFYLSLQLIAQARQCLDLSLSEPEQSNQPSYHWNSELQNYNIIKIYDICYLYIY